MSSGGMSVPAGTPVYSAPMSIPGAYNTMGNYYNAPVATPAPAPTPKPQGGSGPTPTAATTAPAGSGFDMNAWNDALNTYYSPAYSRLDSLAQQYRDQEPLAEQQVNNQYNQALIPIEDNLNTGTSNISQQRQDVYQGQQSAISQARQLYNELMQQGIAKFGAGSSAGPAYAAILGKQTSSNIGGAMQTATNANSKLDSELNNLTKFIGSQKSSLAEQKLTAIGKVQQDLKDKLAAIDSQKGQLDQSKAEQQMQALIDARNRAYQIEDASTAFQRQIDLFNAQTQASIAQKYSVNNGISSDALSQFTKLAPILGIQPAAQVLGIDLSKVQGQLTPYATGTWINLGNGTYYNNQTGEYSQTPPAQSIDAISGILTGNR